MAGPSLPHVAPRAPAPEDDAPVLDALRHGRLEVRGRVVGASNVSLLVEVATEGGESIGGDGREDGGEGGGEPGVGYGTARPQDRRRSTGPALPPAPRTAPALRAIYKPVSGERPLWDFPEGTLAGREVAAYELSAASGLHVVPPTVLREDAPFGPGSVQAWVEGAPDEPGEGLVDIFAPSDVPRGWLHVLDAEGGTGPVALAHAPGHRLRAVALFDVVANNADRKAGHLLRGADGVLRGIDHGLTFNSQDKLRTVLWGWAGQDLRRQDRTVLEGLAGALEGTLGATLACHLTGTEVAATRRRVERLLRTGRYPRPSGAWPPIPWPAF